MRRRATHKAKIAFMQRNGASLIPRYINMAFNIIWIRISKDFPETSTEFKQKIAALVILRLFISANGKYAVNNYLYKKRLK